MCLRINHNLSGGTYLAVLYRNTTVSGYVVPLSGAAETSGFLSDQYVSAQGKVSHSADRNVSGWTILSGCRIACKTAKNAAEGSGV